MDITVSESDRKRSPPATSRARARRRCAGRCSRPPRWRAGLAPREPEGLRFESVWVRQAALRPGVPGPRERAWCQAAAERPPGGRDRRSAVAARGREVRGSRGGGGRRAGPRRAGAALQVRTARTRRTCRSAGRASRSSGQQKPAKTASGRTTVAIRANRSPVRLRRVGDRRLVELEGARRELARRVDQVAGRDEPGPEVLEGRD